MCRWSFGKCVARCRQAVLIGGVVVMMMLVVVSSVLADSFTAPTLSTAEYATTAGAVFTAIGAIWGLRKVIKLLNRS